MVYIHETWTDEDLPPGYYLGAIETSPEGNFVWVIREDDNERVLLPLTPAWDMVIDDGLELAIAIDEAIEEKINQSKNKHFDCEM